MDVPYIMNRGWPLLVSNGLILTLLSWPSEWSKNTSVRSCKP